MTAPAESSAPGQDHPVVAALGLEPHPEGGWYRRTWACPVTVGTPGGIRPAATSILFLLRPGETSRWHRVASAEVWLWQGGGRLTLSLGGDGPEPVLADRRVLGPVGGDGMGAGAGDALQIVVPAGHWQMAEPAGDADVLAGCVVAPGFDFADFELYRG